MTSVQIEQKSYEMPPKEGISIAHFLTVATSTDRSITTRRSSARAFYAEVTATRQGTFSSRISG